MQLKPWGLFVLIAIFGFSIPVSATEVTISCGTEGALEKFLCTKSTKEWAEKTGHTVNIIWAPRTTDQRFEQYTEQLKRGDDTIDVYQIDVIWPGLMAQYFIDLKEYIPEEDIQQHFATIIENNTVNGRLIGMPWFTDVGLLYYRKDLLAQYGARVPETYSELADTALHIQTEERKAGNASMWGFVFQGEPYEGLTCDALEWIAAYNGGTIVDQDGNITVNNPQAVTALDRAADWVGTFVPERVTTFREEDAHLSFNSGDTVFMRNWPYVWNLLDANPMSPVAGKVDVAALPKGGENGNHASTLGGWQLAVSKFSKNPEVAADLVRYLTSKAVQKDRATEGSYAPTIRELYADSEVLRANPVFAKLLVILENSVARPTSQTGEKYREVSEAFWTAVHEVLEGKKNAKDSLVELETELQKIKGESW